MHFDVTVQTRIGRRVEETHAYVDAPSPDEVGAIIGRGHAPGTIRVVGITPAKTSEGRDQIGPVAQQAVVAPVVKTDDELIAAAKCILPLDLAFAIERKLAGLEAEIAALKQAIEQASRRPVLTLDKRKRA